MEEQAMSSFLKTSIMTLLLPLTSQANITGIEEITAAIQSSSQVDCSNMSKEELALHCAHELCGPAERYYESMDSENLTKKLSDQEMAQLKSETMQKINHYKNQVKASLEGFGKNADFTKFTNDDFEKMVTFLSNFGNENSWNKKIMTLQDFQHPELLQIFNIDSSPKMARKLRLLSQEEFEQKNKTPTTGELCDQACKQKLNSYFKGPSLKKIKQKIINELETKTSSPDYLAECSARVAYDKLNQMNNRAEKMNEAKKRIYDNFSKKLSSDTAQQLEDYLNSLELTSTEELNQLDQVFKIPSYPDNSSDDFHLSFNKFLNFQTANCSNMYIQNELTDHFNDEEKRVKLSPFSCHHHDVGEYVLIHELGHAVSHFFANQKISKESATKFRDFKKCTDSVRNHQFSNANLTWHKNNHLTSEEDFADAITILAAPQSPTLPTCVLFNPQRSGYENLDIDKDSIHNHSSAFQRNFQMVIARNLKLPATCEEIKKKYFSDKNFKRCDIK